MSSIYELPPKMRDALVAVGAAEYSYEEAAKMQQCAVGTIKSRVARARATLLRKIRLQEWEWETDHVLQAALSSPSSSHRRNSATSQSP
jgi:RNA polymerase sigma-70 factor (ECF subfamily)